VLCSQPLRGKRTGRPCFPSELPVWLGGIFLRLYSIRILGRFFTFDVAIANGHRIVEQGPYRWLRHPSYLGSLLSQVGFWNDIDKLAGDALAVCCVATAYAYRIPIEEQALVRGLGSDYSDYMRRTWRLIPFVY